MFTIKHEKEFIFIEKKSKFITRTKFIKSENDAATFIKCIKESEKGAVHNCYALRLFDKNRKMVIEKKSDDGEPSGTAGNPMLAVLSGDNIVNILAVTTRYFGGIKLGTGGLVSAYKKGVSEAVKLSEIIEFIDFEIVAVKIPVNEVKHFEYLLSKENIKTIEKVFGIDIIFKIELNVLKQVIFEKIVNQINGRII